MKVQKYKKIAAKTVNKIGRISGGIILTGENYSFSKIPSTIP